MKLLLVRHGETTWNAERRIQGQSESDLTALGRRQAEAVAAALARQEIAAIYSSDSRRAVHTAATIAAPHGLQPILDPRLREMAFGDLEGLTWDEIADRYPRAQSAIQGGEHDYVLPGGGESRDALVARAVAVMNHIQERHPDELVCAVSHGGLIGWFARDVLGIPRDRPSRFRSANCAIHTFEHHADGWFMRAWNDRAHLVLDTAF